MWKSPCKHVYKINVIAVDPSPTLYLYINFVYIRQPDMAIVHVDMNLTMVRLNALYMLYYAVEAQL